jgi:hypothetical protein
MRTLLALLLPLLLGAQSTVLKIDVVEGVGAVRAPGTRTPGFVVHVTDEVGGPVAGVIVSVRLPDEGPGGAFANGLASEIVTTGSDGSASTSPVRWNRLTGSFQVRITAVKENLRAGTLVSQHIAEAAPAAKAASAGRRSFRKWIVIGILSGAATAGYLAGRAASTSPAAKTSESVDIGTPTITIGKP